MRWARLAAINDTIVHHGIATSAAIPLWVMMIGALGIAVGLALFGPKLIHTVGTGITHINKVRAYCIAMAASITVIIASQLGLPISSTHVAVGAVFGVGFLRELLNNRYDTIIAEVRAHHEENNSRDQHVQSFLDEFEHASSEEKSELLQAIKDSSEQVLSKKERKGLKNVHKEQLVQRGVFMRIIAAWFITVPCSALLSAFFFFTLKGFFSLIFKLLNM
jgi:Phosphate/sulphate permeases